MGQIRQSPSAVSGTREKFRITLNRDEVLALDQYFTWRVGWIGHEELADQVANEFADIISNMAEEIRKSDANDSTR